jgi:hypothetical protein
MRGVFRVTARELVFAEVPAPVASVAAAVGPPRWVRAAVALSVLTAGLLNLALPDLMTLSGRRGTEFIAVALIPLFAVSLRRGVGAWLRDDLRPLLGITAMLALSLLVGEFLTDGVVKVFVTLSGVAWAVVVLDEPHALGLIARWGTWLCLVGLALSLASRGALSPPSHLLALAVLYARLLRDEDAPAPTPRALDVLGDLALVAMVFLSTFRAATLAAALALLAASSVSRRARWVLGLCAALAIPALALAGDASQEPSYANVVARDDWQARYTGLGDDRLSGRADIWENVWRDVADGPAWLLTGRGTGDVDFYVARVNPTYNAQRRGDERAVHTHNTVLELVLGAGVGTLIPLLWLVALAARRSRRSWVLAGCSAGVMVVSLSNVPMMDWTGGTILGAVWLWGLARPAKDAQGIDPARGIQHGPAPRRPHDPPRTDPALPGREALS